MGEWKGRNQRILGHFSKVERVRKRRTGNILERPAVKAATSLQADYCRFRLFQHGWVVGMDKAGLTKKGTIDHENGNPNQIPTFLNCGFVSVAIAQA